MFARNALGRAVRFPAVLSARFQSTSGTSPILSKFRADLKTAMKEKDKSRLTALRGVLAEITNLSKTLKTDQQLTDLHVLKVLNQTIAKSQAALDEATQVGRQDLVDKEQEQLDIIRKYLSDVKVATPDDIQKAVQEIIKTVPEGKGKAAFGEVMKGALKLLEGRNAVPKDVSEAVKKALEGKN